MSDEETKVKPVTADEAIKILTPHAGEKGKYEGNTIRFMHERPDKPGESAWVICVRDHETESVRACISALATEKAGLERDFADMRESATGLQRLAIELKADRDRLRAALEKYGQHERNCHDHPSLPDGPWGTRLDCNCGLAAALSPDNTKE
jgi:hypothetical protein